MQCHQKWIQQPGKDHQQKHEIYAVAFSDSFFGLIFRTLPGLLAGHIIVDPVPTNSSHKFVKIRRIRQEVTHFLVSSRG